MAAWSDLTGIELDAWEARTIRSLSEVFVAERHRARKPACMAPYSALPAENRARVDTQFKALVGALAGRKGG